jgi:hypothetical protein
MAFSWSNDDQLLQYVDPGTSQLTIVSSTAMVVETLPTSGLINASAFAPDSSHIMYFAPDGSGGTELRVHLIGGASDVHIQGLPDPNNNSLLSLEFTRDGAALLFISAANSGPDYSRTLWYASATTSGQASAISHNLDQTYFASPASGGNVAIVQQLPPDFVFSLSGSTSTTVAHGAPNYEPGANHPRLLITPFNQTVTSVMVASTDGSNALAIQLPVALGEVTWLGHSLLVSSAGTRTADPQSDYYALHSQGSAWVALARAAENLIHAPIPSPTRAFYTRRASNASGPAGLWMVSLP